MSKQQIAVVGVILVWLLSVTAAQEPDRGVLIGPAPKTKAGGQRWALIIGINDYANVPALRYGRSDAEALARVLVEKCGFPKDNVVLMTDAQDVRSNDFARYPTRGNLRARIDLIAQVAEQNDLLIVSFSGHGLNIDGRGYLVPVDGASNDIGSVIPVSWVKEALESSPAKQRLLLLDARHSGAARGDPTESPAEALLSPLAGAAFATIASCDSRQLSHEDPKTGHGVFTQAVIKGLTGKADSQAEGNRDSTITANELFAYASLKVEQWSLREGKKQTPVLRGEFKDRIELAQIGVSDASNKPAESTLVTTAPVNPKTRIRRPGEIFTNSIGMKLVHIPAGSFMMGSSDSPAQLARRYDTKEEYFGDEFPQHQVRISKGFWMGQTEVTQAQYKSVMNAQPWSEMDYVQQSDSNPAVCVSWDDAAAFCRKLSQQESITYRLPTEAEWEYAYRAGTTARYSFGDSDSSLGDYAWFSDNTRDVDQEYAHVVGRKKPNSWGLYDMHGNVYEWCSDWYKEDYYAQSPRDNPTGPSSGTAHSMRGGSWYGYELGLRCSERAWGSPDLRVLNVGFRVVRSQS
jgi:formylglycine-generating enzyme required for sulfatase activity